MKRLSIHLRLALSYLAIFLLAELVIGAGLWLILRQDLFGMVDDALQGQTANLERFLEARSDIPMLKLQAEIAENYRIEASEDYVQVIDAAGNSLYRSRFLDQHPLPPISLDNLDRPFYQNRSLGNQRFRFISEQIDVNGRAYVVRIAHPMDEESDTLDDVRRYLLWFAPFLLLGASGVGYWINRRALAPVDALARSARAISGHDSRIEIAAGPPAVEPATSLRRSHDEP